MKACRTAAGISARAKLSKLVAVLETPQLTARLAAAKARVAELVLPLGTRPETVIVDERTGRAYVQDTYRAVFSQVRMVAAHGMLEGEAIADIEARAAREKEHGRKLYNVPWRLEPMPSIAGKRDQDLRDTAVTWLARAGSTMGEICAVTGHSAKSVQTIIEHYLGAHARARGRGDQKTDGMDAERGDRGLMRTLTKEEQAFIAVALKVAGEQYLKTGAAVSDPKERVALYERAQSAFNLADELEQAAA
jgi:hypothetical protein